MFTIEETKFGDHKCFICGGDFHHTKGWYKFDNEPLPVLKMRVSHRSCEKLVDEIEAKKKELIELEFKLFCKKNPVDIHYEEPVQIII
jgi:hypothetical protein